MHHCVDGALDSGLRIDADDLQRRELGQGLQRDLEQLVRAEAAASSTFVPRELEVTFKGYELAPGVAVGGKIDRVDVDPHQRPRDRRRLQVRRGAVGDADPRRGAAADPALPARAPRPARARADGRRLHAARRRPPAARDAARRRRAGAGLRRGRLPRRDGVRGRDRACARGLRSCSRSGSGRGTSSTTRTAATARRGATSGGCAGRSGRERPSVTARSEAPADDPNPQQQAAIDARGSTFVSAGAGTGKTTVLVERFARAVLVDGLDVDSLLVITYTDRAAGELRARIRSRLLELGRPDLARDLDGAWISTIHGFCRRLLTAYPLAAGIDPRFRVLDESQARVLQGEAFNAALEAFCAADEPDRWQLLATYRSAGLPQDARQRLRHAALGRPRADARAGACARASTTRSTSCAPRSTRSSPTRRRRSRSATPRPTRSISSRRRACRSA